MDQRICGFCGEPLPDTIPGSYCYECEGFSPDDEPEQDVAPSGHGSKTDPSTHSSRNRPDDDTDAARFARSEENRKGPTLLALLAAKREAQE